MFSIASVYSFLGSLAETILQFLHNLGLEWGFVIILATLLLRIIISPFSWKQIRTIYLLRELNPEVKKIQAYYDTDIEGMNKATMQLYAKNKFHIFGIIVPTLLQAPFLISIFVYLNSPSFKKDLGDNKSFLFVNNILESTNAHTGTLFGLVGIYIVIQILSTILNSRLKIQTKSLVISLVLSIIVTLFLIPFPAALMIYWISSSFFLLVQQALMKWLVPKPKIIPWEQSSQKEIADNL